MTCPDCFKGTIHQGEPRGSEETIHGVLTYVTSPHLEYVKSTIIFTADAFGFNLVNSKLLADYYAAKTGIRVLLLEIIPGGGVPLTTLGVDSGGVFLNILAYARAVKADVVSDGGKLGGKLSLTGFCWEGLQTTRLSQELDIKGGDVGFVDCHFTAHPVGLKTEDFVEGVRKFKAPFSMAVGEEDAYLKKENVTSIEAALRTELGVDYVYEVEVYPDWGDRFAVRADSNRIVENEAAGKACEQAVTHFLKHLD